MSIRSAVSVKLLLAIIVTGGPLLADTWIPPQIIPGNSFPVFSSGDVSLLLILRQGSLLLHGMASYRRQFSSDPY